MPEERTGQRLILADGTRIENGTAGYASGFLWLKLQDYTMQEAAAIAFDPEKTETILFQYGEMEDEYNGFTECRTLLKDEDAVSVCLTKAVE